MKENENQREVCQAGSCGCSANYIYLGIVIIFFTIGLAMIFGN